MKLAKYLEIKGQKPCAFAREIGVPNSTITRLFHPDRRGPRVDLMQKIAKATGGAVMPNDFLPDSDATTEGAAQ